ncbi:MAG: ferritin-like domain-containing protein [Proteobacteria bacterium]|nr:ferritin-like domain-containing protein [Pseudomonadota bacterium]
MDPNPIAHEWQRRVVAEYRSAALTAQLVHWMTVAGFPHELIAEAMDVVRDELDHARLSTEAMQAYGGIEPPTLNPRTLAHPERSEGLLASLVDSVLRNFCLGETLAVPLFQAMWQSVSDEPARVVVQRVLKDEARHRQLGWDLLDELIAREPAVAAFCESRLEHHLGETERAYAFAPDGPAPSPEHAAAGLIGPAEYHRVFWETVRGDLAERFAQRGIALPARWTGEG